MTYKEKLKKDLKEIWNVPNMLTILRLLSVGVFVYLFLHENYKAAIIVFIVAALTDLLDGYIARKYNLITNFGKLMDPVADKVMLVAALFCLVTKGLIPWWIVVFVLIKEISSVIIGFVCYLKGVVVYSELAGKVASAAFNIAVVFNLLKNTFLPVIATYNLDMIVFYIAIGAAILSLFQYTSQVTTKLKNK